MVDILKITDKDDRDIQIITNLYCQQTSNLNIINRTTEDISIKRRVFFYWGGESSEDTNFSWRGTRRHPDGEEKSAARYRTPSAACYLNFLRFYSWFNQNDNSMTCTGASQGLINPTSSKSLLTLHLNLLLLHNFSNQSAHIFLVFLALHHQFYQIFYYSTTNPVLITNNAIFHSPTPYALSCLPIDNECNAVIFILLV